MEVEYAGPGWGEGRPATGHNVNVIIQWVVSARQSDWTMVRSSRGDNSHEAPLTRLDQEVQSAASSRCNSNGRAADPPSSFTFLPSSLLFLLFFPLVRARGGTAKPGQHMCLIASFELRIRPRSVLLT